MNTDFSKARTTRRSTLWLMLQLATFLASNFFYTCRAFQSPAQPRMQKPTNKYLSPNYDFQQSRLHLGIDSDTENETNNNPLSSFFDSILAQPKEQETEEEKEARLNRERQQEMAILEAKRADKVREDAIAYLFLLSLQLLPLVGSDMWINRLYFLGTAITTVYLGSRQLTVYQPETVSKKSALGAPIGASIAIGFLYALIKFGLDPTTVYSFLVTIYGVFGIYDIGIPLLRAAASPITDLSDAEIALPEGIAEAIKLNPPYTIPVDKLVALGVGIAASIAYWSPILPISDKFLVSNLIAWSIGMASLGVISLGSFQTGAILLGGLFFYDIFFVFGTDVMMTVALKIEAPVKLLYPAPPSDVPRDYPFSVLGLGDVVIPGLFVRFMTKLDEKLQPLKFSYATATTIAYGVGLVVCFVVNEYTESGQPALLYLDPACVGAALACGVVNEQLPEVWAFEDEEAMKKVKEA